MPMSRDLRREVITQKLDSREKIEGSSRPVKNEIVRAPAAEDMVEIRVNLLLLGSETQYIRDKKSFVSSMKKSLKSRANNSSKFEQDDS